MKFWPFNRPKVDQKAGSFVSPDEAFLAMFGVVTTSSNMMVTPTTAMRCPAVRCAVETIAEGVGNLPLITYERAKDSSKSRAKDNPIYSLLHGNANDWTASGDFIEQLTRDALLHGNGFGFINRVNDIPKELIRIDPTKIKIECDDTTLEPTYTMRDGEKKGHQIPRGDLIHIKAPSLNGVSGESPVTACKEAIGVALVMEQHAARLFGSGAKPGGVIEIPGKLGDGGYKNLIAGWTAANEGTTNAGKTAVLWDGAKFNQNALSSVDAQFLELWKHSITEIARVFRVPPHLIFELGRATWGNATEMGATFLRFTLMRWLKAWEGEIRLKLFREEDRATFFSEFLVDDLLRADISQRAEAYSKLIASRVLSPNEARAMENRAPYAGGDVFENPNTSSGGVSDNGPE